MKRFVAPLAAALLASLPSAPVRADDAKDANAVLDKAVQALGGADKLGKLHAYQLRSKGKITFGGAESTVTGQATVQGLDHTRVEFEGEFGGMKVHGVTVISGTKGWRKV